MSQHLKSNLFPYYFVRLIIIIFLVNINMIYSLISNKKSDEYLGSTGKHLFHFVQVIIFFRERKFLIKFLY